MTRSNQVEHSMQNRRYKAGIDRREPMPFPPLLDDYISADNPVRAIDSYVESLELASFGFCNAQAPVPEVGYQAGQPAYPPQALLKLYLYGYLNRVRSSRRLEKETHRNVEVMWLLQGLRPSYKTIADFRKDNAPALRRVNRDFVVLCKELDLLGKELVGIDGSFFRASASKASIHTQARLEQELKRIEQDIEHSLGQLNDADRSDGDQGLASLADDPELPRSWKRSSSANATTGGYLRNWSTPARANIRAPIPMPACCPSAATR